MPRPPSRKSSPASKPAAPLRERRWPRLLLRIFILWLIAPYVLTVVYLVVPPPSTLMLARWATAQSAQRHWIPLSQMSPSLIGAVLTSEDSAFCSHYGLDMNQIERSLKRAHKSDRPVRATSTITQQTVKNLFFWPGRSWIRKALEVPLSLWMELLWSKKRILETYLNIAQWGKSVYGVEAASRVHFGIPARNISAYQAATLATSLPNPIKRVAGVPGPGQKFLTAQLLGRMKKAGADTSCVRR